MLLNVFASFPENNSHVLLENILLLTCLPYNEMYLFCHVSGKFTAFAKRFNKWTWKRILIFLFPMRITVKCYKAAQQINGRWSGIGLIISVI